MRTFLIVVALVIVGIVGAWAGYWVGHAAGWSTNAEFPLKIGGGDGAILLSIAFSIASVWVVGLWFVARPVWRERQLLARGASGHGRIVRVWRTGVLARHAGGRTEHQLAFEIEMHPAEGRAYRARATRMATEAEEQALAPGTEVDVRYDPAHPATAAVAGMMQSPMS